MAFTLDHWNNPRETISNELKDNDLAYITHGTKQVIEFLKYVNDLPANLVNKKLLDYGCGGGKFTRLMSFLFLESWGYDPVTNCINLANEELALTNKDKELVNPDKIRLINDIAVIPKNHFDYVSSINVFEHLNERDAVKAMNNIISLLSPKGKAILWLHNKNNSKLISRYNLQQAASGSTIGIYKYS